MTKQAQENFKGALRQLVREHMPWPYDDVERDGEEARDTAQAIADPAADRMLTEFAAIETGK